MWAGVGNPKCTWKEELKSMNIVLQGRAYSRIPSFQDPSGGEFAKTDEARQLIKIGIQDVSTLGHSYTLPPKVRKDRVDTFRKAFDATMRDPSSSLKLDIQYYYQSNARRRTRRNRVRL